MSTGRRDIDFLIIGAQKSGTTSLYRYLSAHPAIYMPPGKELAFFSDPEKVRKGIDHYLDNYFADAPGDTLIGEASPQYMCADGVAPAIAAALPNVKLIAILRNPVTRAYSHYRMAVRRQIEPRDFDRCIDELLAGGTGQGVHLDMDRDFVRLGEYGRILAGYLTYFGRDQIKVVFTEDLRDDPNAVLSDTFRFLGVDPDFRAEIMGTRFHQGGTRRFTWLERFSNLPGVRALIRAILPSDLRRALGYWFITQVVVKPERETGPNEATRRRLAEHFRSDVDILVKNFGVSPPWPEMRDHDTDETAI